jgi:hypothetical protein
MYECDMNECMQLSNRSRVKLFTIGQTLNGLSKKLYISLHRFDGVGWQNHCSNQAHLLRGLEEV